MQAFVVFQRLFNFPYAVGIDVSIKQCSQSPILCDLFSEVGRARKVCGDCLDGLDVAYETVARNLAAHSSRFGGNGCVLAGKSCNLCCNQDYGQVGCSTLTLYHILHGAKAL